MPGIADRAAEDEAEAQWRVQVNQSGYSTLAADASGVITAVPLMMFAVGARRLPLATVGFLQYIAPSLNFLVAVLLFREPFDTTQLVGFGLIWLALAVYSADLLHAGRKAAKAR